MTETTKVPFPYYDFKVDAKGVQTCVLCSAVVPSLKTPTGVEKADRGAANMVHMVREHLDYVNQKKWQG